MMQLSEDSQRPQQDTESEALASFLGILRGLPDPRRLQGRRYPLDTVVIVALMAMVCGREDAEAMEEWGQTNAKWLSTFLSMPHGAPTQDVFLRVLGALNPVAFQVVFRSWVGLLRARLAGLQGKHVAVDGKTIRRACDADGKRLAPHVVSAWLTAEGLVLGQVKTDTKSNEITAIPELLRLLDLRGVTVTIDAMGCQTEIAKTILDCGGDFLLAVKDNQPSLHKDIVDTFAAATDPNSQLKGVAAQPVVTTFETIEKDHGRLEQRTITVCDDLRRLSTQDRWTGLNFVVEVTRVRTDLSKQKTSIETAHYIGSRANTTAEQAAGFIRGHWGIENSLHWVLDVSFREDEARQRAGNAGQNFSLLRHFALNIIKQDTNRHLGVANTRKRAGGDRNYLIHLMTGAKV